jgi:enolase
MPKIKQLVGFEILDSRGRPTVMARCVFESGVSAEASVPSGASTGTAEALELRDGDSTRYRGLGCLKAVESINGEMNKKLAGTSFDSQEALDRKMMEIDGTPNKSRLGANATLAVSLAFARAFAREQQKDLYAYFSDLVGNQKPALPRLTINLFSGGKHAGGQVEIQDVLAVPLSAKSVDESLAMMYAIYQKAAELIMKKYGMRLLRADEGGLAPPFESVEKMLEAAVEVFQSAGLKPGEDVGIAVDVASSHFYQDGKYVIGGKSLDSAQMIQKIESWANAYPLVSVEDGLSENDWDNWPKLAQLLGGKILVLGDDFLCTNPERIRRAVDAKAATALLLKVNQIGTLSEAAESCRIAKKAGWQVTVSARSGETEDDWLGDLATAWGNQIKVGSITQSERLAKYNRLLILEKTSGLKLREWRS